MQKFCLRSLRFLTSDVDSFNAPAGTERTQGSRSYSGRGAFRAASPFTVQTGKTLPLGFVALQRIHVKLR